MSKSSVSRTIIYEGGDPISVTAAELSTTQIDALDSVNALSILWTLYIKSINKYYGCQIFAVKKSSEVDFNVYSIAGDDINIDFEVIIDGTVVLLNIINNEAFNLTIKGRRTDII